MKEFYTGPRWPGNASSIVSDFAECAPPPPAPTIHIAHCIAGASTTSRPYYSRPFAWDETWVALAHWMYALRRASFEQDAFLVMDNTDYLPKPRAPTNGERPIDIIMRESFPIGPEGVRNVSVNWSAQRVIDAFKVGASHVEVADAEIGVCTRANGSATFNCTCDLARASTPRFFEMLGKNAQCLRMLTAHERTRQAPYAYVTKMRPDPNIAIEWWMRPAWLRAVLQLPEAHRTSVVTPWINGQCYSWSDWFALLPRAHAGRYLNASEELSCNWLACARRAYGKNAVAKGGHCLYTERLLVEWLLSGRNGPMLRAAPAPRVLTNATGWCGDDNNMLPQWLARAHSLVRGPGSETLRHLQHSGDATIGPIGFRDKTSAGAHAASEHAPKPTDAASAPLAALSVEGVSSRGGWHKASVLQCSR